MEGEFIRIDTTQNPMLDLHDALLDSPSERAGWYCHRGANALIKHWMRHGIEEIVKEALRRREDEFGDS